MTWHAENQMASELTTQPMPEPSAPVLLVRRRTVLDWLGENPYVGVAVVVHLFLFLGLYSVVIEPETEIEGKKQKELLLTIQASLNDEEDEAGAMAGRLSPFAAPTPLPGLSKDRTAAQNTGGQARSPTPPVVRALSPTGQAATVSAQRSSGLSNSLAGQGVAGDGDSGQGNIAGGAYGLRDGDGRGIGTRTHGGNARSESAVDAGLKWLSRHQYQGELQRRGAVPLRIGFWRPAEFHNDATDDAGNKLQCVCGEGVHARGTPDNNLGVTALVLLAFLGAGHKPGEGDYGDLMERGVNWLVATQDSQGRFGSKESMYSHALATLVLAEALVLTRNETWRKPVQAGVQYLCEMQTRHGGWDYYGKGPRSDTSISSWCLMALKSAHAAGVTVPKIVWLRAIHHFRRMTTADGDTQYADTLADVRYGSAMIATGLFCRLLLGAARDDAMVLKQAGRLLGNLPNGGKLLRQDTELERMNNNYYAWYIGTLAAFFHGGDTWLQWNSVMRDTAIRLQVSDKTHRRGSWDAVDTWSSHGGRIYATAMMVLTLEVYYRYVPEYVLSDAASLRKYWNRDLLYTALGEELDQEPPTQRRNR